MAKSSKRAKDAEDQVTELAEELTVQRRRLDEQGAWESKVCAREPSSHARQQHHSTFCTHMHSHASELACTKQ